MLVKSHLHDFDYYSRYIFGKMITFPGKYFQYVESQSMLKSVVDSWLKGHPLKQLRL